MWHFQCKPTNMTNSRLSKKLWCVLLLGLPCLGFFLYGRNMSPAARLHSHMIRFPTILKFRPQLTPVSEKRNKSATSYEWTQWNVSLQKVEMLHQVLNPPKKIQRRKYPGMLENLHKKSLASMNNSLSQRLNAFKSNSASLNTTMNVNSSSGSNDTVEEEFPIVIEPLPGIWRNLSGPPCPPIPPNLKGELHVQLKAPSWDTLNKMHPELEVGGRYHPRECVTSNHVAIIIPYRDRDEHLQILLQHLHPMLQCQQLDYGIYVVEQMDTRLFNRAMLFNVGFHEASLLYPYDCFIFHDVDLIPEDDRNLYTCTTEPRHMSVSIKSFNYRLPYHDLFGGVSALSREQFQAINGFSNSYWGWGGEDDDISYRLRTRGYYLARYPSNIARYIMLSHPKSKGNPKRNQLLKTSRKRMSTDGLNSLKYQREDLVFRRLYTLIQVRLS